MTIREAALRLGVSEGAVRKRIARGRLRSDMGADGRRRVRVPSSAPEPPVEGSGELVGQLRSEVEYLRGQLEQEREARRRADHIIASLAARIPELEAPEAGEDHAGGDAAGDEGVGPGGEGGEPQAGGDRRTWWRRWLGG
jgi:excisionase family DNA binding protein